MTAGPKYEYLWADGVTVKKATAMPAPEYVDNLMTWIQDKLDDEHLFPLEPNTPFPKNYLATVKKIFCRLFRVYGHIYHIHFDQLLAMESVAHLNTCFKHFMMFVREFDLVEKKEQEPLRELIEKLFE
eukprot:CAMPEP_0177663642 /NCGR_PEP_ID=MMETSP0447-20121125/20031_1 /TAXON_ID=0 /ORGANISM="Stygamoeba regulata, Strain BSH-02190019" /LENGTH=127 /DNA_ID=CAMNT_0019169485 /DNA_START=361 /DNA_END=744 /DNA_ORIENTATION=+